MGATVCPYHHEPQRKRRPSDCIVEFKGRLPEGAETAEERPDDAYIHVRPSGNIFEPAMLILLDSIVCSLMVKGHMGMKIVRYNHANLE